MNKVIIGYQGLENSNNNRAAIELSQRFLSQNIEVELLPLLSSANVVNALKKGEITYGVMAQSGTDGWLVPETTDACRHVDLELVDKICIEIHHCLFKKNRDIALSQIRKVASHQVALLVCHNHIHDIFPNAKEVETADTALSAKELSEGILSEDTAIICSKEAGEQYGLCLIRDNMQDHNPNGVNFILVKPAKQHA